MTLRKGRLPGSGVAPDEPDELLSCRTAMLGIDESVIKGGGTEVLLEVIRNCPDCGHRDICEADLKRDPNDPIWETYCPNAKALLELAAESWKVR
jgi:hypothetical protein